ncbi:hypothetical protein [Streptomyces sp. TLI_146]|uniref:hypothetical protein n=1 Tax=Streptomyces sp. TLI_146 TaxID=1938858 RepID=UPI000CB47E1A|nr:hypothetical protein [Streptomyces sp. TLI_146]PKV84088.1 hypothetical protein BX283_1599 [Streptomyces sp. TLI_146]
MYSTLTRRCARMAAAGALSVALLAGSAAAAAAASPTPKPSPSGSKYASAAPGSLTIKASATEAKVGDKVTFTGRSKGLAIGSKVVLQHKKGSKWTTLHADTTIKQGSSYSLDYKVNTKGKEQLRVMDGATVSPTVTVTVK